MNVLWSSRNILNQSRIKSYGKIPSTIMFSRHVWQLKTGNHTFQVTWFTPSSTRAEANKDYLCSLFTDFVIAKASWPASQLAEPYTTQSYLAKVMGNQKRCWPPKQDFNISVTCGIFYGVLTPIFDVRKHPILPVTIHPKWKETKSYTRRHCINVMVIMSGIKAIHM